MQANEFQNATRDMKFMHLFSQELRDEVTDILRDISELRTVPAGGAWIREGEQADDKGYILLSGAIAIRKADGPEHQADAPELLGEIMQFNPTHRRTATVVAAEECVVARFLWSDFWVQTKERLSEQDQAVVKEALESIAWEHFTG